MTARIVAPSQHLLLGELGHQLSSVPKLAHRPVLGPRRQAGRRRDLSRGVFPREDGQLHPTEASPALSLRLIGPGSGGMLRESPTAEVQRQMDASGVAAVRGAMGYEWLEQACLAVGDVVFGDDDDDAGDDGQGVVIGGAQARDNGFLQFTLQAVTGRSAGLRTFVRSSPVAELAAAMLLRDGSDVDSSTREVAFEADDIFVKVPQCPERTPWHRDVASLPFSGPGDGPRTINIWMALDDIPERFCLRVIEGSHRWAPGSLGSPLQEEYAAAVLGADWRSRAAGALSLPTTLCSADRDDLVTTFAIEQMELKDPDGFDEIMKPIAFDTLAGDCILFHRQAIHGARGNLQDSSRAALSTRWCTHSRGHPELRPRYEQNLTI